MFRGELADRRILFHLIKSASASGARGEGKTDHRFLSAPKPVPSATQFSRRPAATLFCREGSPTCPVKSPPPPDSACRSDRVEGYLMWRRDGRLPDRPWDRPGTDPGPTPGHRRERRQRQPVASNGASLGYGTPTSSADEGRVPCVLHGPDLRQSRPPPVQASGQSRQRR